MAEAVVFAMLASYLLSRTVVPTMARYLLNEHDEAEAEKKKSSRNPFTRFQLGFEYAIRKVPRRLSAVPDSVHRSCRRVSDPVYRLRDWLRSAL